MNTLRKATLLTALMVIVIGGGVGFAANDLGAVDAAVPAETATVEKATVARVIDGDTITVTVDSDTAPRRVRLIGIDTPELLHGKGPDQCYAQEARTQLEQLLPEGTAVELHSDPTQGNADKYDRLLRHVTVAGTDTNVVSTLLSAGAGPEYTYNTEYDGQAEYRAAEHTAKQAQQGYWGACH